MKAPNFTEGTGVILVVALCVIAIWVAKTSLAPTLPLPKSAPAPIVQPTQTPADWYALGTRAVVAKQWANAVDSFTAAGTYKDAPVRLAACRRHYEEEQARIRAEEEKARKAQERQRVIEEERRLLAAVDGSRAKYRKFLKLRKEHQEWSEDDCITIARRKVQIGFTREQTIAAWGKPRDINRSVGSYGTHEQWVYGGIDGTYLYFEDGIMTSWQD
jgi:hypothetical protein